MNVRFLSRPQESIISLFFNDLSDSHPLSEQAIQVLSKVDIIIIDEISMVSDTLFSYVDTRLRAIRNTQIPFGGVRLIMIGDIYQLPPVEINDGYFFESEIFNDPAFSDAIEYYSFEHSFRHQSDQLFAGLLDRMRINALSNADFHTLNSRCLYTLKPMPVNPVYPTVCSTNDEALGTNTLAIYSQGIEVFTVEPEITYFFDSRNITVQDSPLAAGMEIGINCPVIFMLNIPGDIIFRGLRGIIKAVTIKHGKPETVTIQTITGRTVYLQKKDTYILKPVYNEKTKRMGEIAVAQINNFPFIPCFGLTIHKSQGLTLNQATVNKGTGFFAPGQCYVACSRVASLKNLYLLQEITKDDLKTNSAVTEFITSIENRVKKVYPE